MDWKRICKKLLFPPVWLLVPATLISAAALTLVFVNGMEQSISACIVYALAFYTLCTVSIFCVSVLPKQYRQIRRRICSHPFGKRFLADRVFRTNVSLSVSLAISIFYAGAHVWSWYLLRSRWFLVLAVYYTIMAAMRFLLVRYFRIQKIGTSILKEWKRARICAYILLLINLSLSGAVLMILYRSKGYDYPGVMIYAMALYTFYSTVHSIVDIVRYRKLGSPVMSTAKLVSFSGALVSMLNLETAMFAQFGGDMRPESQQLFIILTGAGVSITIVTLAVILIVNANKEIRRNKHGK